VSVPPPLRLRPLEVGDLLDETFRMYRRHFVLFAGLSVILSIPAAGLSGFLTGSLLTDLNQVAASGQAPNLANFESTLAVAGIFLIIDLALVPFFYGAVAYAACESALGRPVTAQGVLRAVARRYFALFGYWFLIGLMGVVFCLLPLWIWIWVNWIVVMPVMFIENSSLGAAMSRSWRLVQGRWWRTFLTLFLMFIIFYVVRIALSAFLALGQALLQLVVSSVVVLWISGVTTVIVDALVNPILQIVIVLIYFDLRVRREGLDLFQLAQSLPPPPPPPPPLAPGMATVT
jgi:hypothetical protein